MYIRTFYNFCCCFLLRSRLSTSLPPHTHTHIVLLHFMHTQIFFFLSHSYSYASHLARFGILGPAFCLLFSFYRKCYIFFLPFAASFSILGHSMRFLSVCVMFMVIVMFSSVLVWIIFPSFCYFFLSFFFAAVVFCFVCPCFIATSVVSICYAMQFTKLRFACAGQINKIP